MKIVSWNVNSIRARLERAQKWIGEHTPDVLCLQELKCVEESFPLEAFQELGYHAAVHGQKTYNGVAILSKSSPGDVVCGLGDGVEDPQARLVMATVNGVRVLSVYVPNGSELGSDKYQYKLQWLKRLREFLDRNCDPTEPLAICGDYNVAPGDADIANPEAWEESVLTDGEVRSAMKNVLDWGLVDSFRLHHPEGGHYSWWDYRRLAFPKNDGMRIDQIYVTDALAKNCESAMIDRNERKGKQPSDHAPVIANFSL